MKRLILFVGSVLLLLPFGTVGAQILNAGFESWTNGNPDNWFTNNAAPLYTTVTQSTDAHSGSSALKGATVSYSSVVLAPTVAAGIADQGFSVSARISSITGYYKFTPVGGDSLYIIVVMNSGVTGIGGGLLAIGTTVAAYTQFTVPIIYTTADTPDKITIQFSLRPGSTSYHVGTTYLIDDLALGNVTSVKEDMSSVPAVFNLEQNYPNPFNPSTNIKFTVPADGQATLKVFNTLGQEVATLFNGEVAAGVIHLARFDASNLSSGIYFSQLEFGGRVQIKKMVLMK